MELTRLPPARKVINEGHLRNRSMTIKLSLALVS